ncbi:hypothetical protein MTR67_043474 [Solanum verrucosum]|uniref:Reverse transcriptase domain-containing protein n=1 Tax=Solanum verrucosum TaxID=315347 RepID=A0AAF0ZV66_SOLVR|nr:hypothetical protein MTR67_043474 [Solanum verrucosum]
MGLLGVSKASSLSFNGVELSWMISLDRFMVNDKWLEVMPQTTIENLSSVGSDHSPMLMEMTRVNESHIKYFKFLHFWVDNVTFLKTVQQCWEKGVIGNPMWRLHKKMKRVTSTLSNWSKQEYGDIFTKGEEQIAQAACDYYQQMFTGQNDRIDERILQLIPIVVTPEHNDMMQAMPNIEELRQVVFAMNPNSAAGPDGIGGAEVLTRLLNSLHQNPSYKGFFMEPKGPQINHLSFADDVIAFASIDRQSLKLIMDNLGEYEHTSGQLINKAKSHFMVPNNTSQDIIHTNQAATTFSQKSSHISYLGCPLYIGRQRIIYYSHFVEKVSKKMCGWQARVLSFGGRITLIKHALQSIPIHTMATISPLAILLNTLR